MFKNEKELQLVLSNWLDLHSIKNIVEFRATQKVRPDIAVVDFKHDLIFLIEVKLDLNKKLSNIKSASEFFYQCSRYEHEFKVPTYLGPFFYEQNSEKQTAPVRNFLEFAKFFNVGLMFVKISGNQWIKSNFMLGGASTYSTSTLTKKHIKNFKASIAKGKGCSLKTYETLAKYLGVE